MYYGSARPPHTSVLVIYMFTYLMMSKLTYLLMDWETINCLHDCIRIDRKCYQALQISQEFFEKKCNINLSKSIILSKGVIWDAWLDPKCSSAGGFNRLFKIQAQRYLAASRDAIILKFKSVNYLSISRPL